MAFFATREGGKTVALVDIESGSVGAALVRLSPREAPKLFGETRIAIPLLRTRDADVLSGAIERATQDALLHISTVATRLRNHDAVAPQGEVARAAVFFSAPWATTHLAGGTPNMYEPLLRSADLGIQSTLGDIPTSFHPLGTAAAHGATLFFQDSRPVLICIISAEVTELLLLSDGRLLGRATVPLGSHALLRTLVSHTGMSAAEARSFAHLPRSDTLNHEPLTFAEDDFAAQIEDAARDLSSLAELTGIIVLAHEPANEPLARALARSTTLAELFPDGGTVRTARAAHAMPYIAAHAKNPDLHLMLEALFIDRKFGGI